MSTTNTPSDSPQGEQLEKEVDEKYTAPVGVEPSDASVGGDDHPVAEALGEQDHYEFQYDPRATGKSIAERYDEPAAALREYIHNAETACIRAVRHKLKQVGYSEGDILDMSIDEALDLAREETGYDPVIEITHRWPGSNGPALEIADNGIGISIEEFVVMRKHARSSSFMDGTVGGQFGQGLYSVFMLIGHNGEGKFVTKSRVDDKSYEMRMRLTGFNEMPGSRDAYGTTFTFPSLSQEGQDVDTASKVAEYCQGIRIPVNYEEYDESGTIVFEDDFLPTKFEDDYDEVDPVVVYDTEYFRAVSSPGVTTSDRNPKTLLTSMPIERNDARFGTTDNDKFEAPWKFDIRLKYEDGRVAFGPNAGLVPVEDATYESMDEERKEHYVPRPDLTADDVEMPKPVDDRDRLKDGYRDFFKRVSEGLSREFADQYARVLASVDDFSDIGTMDLRDRTLFVRGYSHFGPKTSRNNPQTVQEKLEEEVGVTVPQPVCEKLTHIKDELAVVPRGTNKPHKKGKKGRNREDRKAWKLIVNAEPDADVYMGKTISEKKCRMVWDLHENNFVVQLGDDQSYRTYEDLFGWKKLKDLPSQNLAEKIPELSDEFLDEWDTQSGSSGGTGVGQRGSFDRDRAKKRRIKVRQGVGRGTYKKHKASYVHETIDNGEWLRVGGYKSSISELVVVDQNEYGVHYYDHLCGHHVGQTVVPKYVVEYLLEADNAYTPGGIREEYGSRTIEFDWKDDSRRYASFDRISNLTQDDVIFTVHESTIDWAKRNVDNLTDVIQSIYPNSDVRSVTVMTPDDMVEYWLALRDLDGSNHQSEAKIIKARNAGTLPRGVSGERIGMDNVELYLSVELPEDRFVRDSIEWYSLFGDSPMKLTDELERKVQMVQELDECRDDHPFPSQRIES